MAHIFGHAIVAKRTIDLGKVLGVELLEPQVARSIIEQRVRQAIVDGRLPSGTAIRQQELADNFGVSRMPVREALRQLEAQGLVEVEQHKGAVVAPIGGGDAIEAYGIRRVLESEALRLSIPRLTEQDLADAQACVDQLGVERDIGRMARLNHDFHMALYGRADNSRLLRLVETGLLEEERFVRMNLVDAGLAPVAQDDHQRLLDAARNGQIEEAVTLLQAHLARGIAVMEQLKASPHAE